MRNTVTLNRAARLNGGILRRILSLALVGAIIGSMSISTSAAGPKTNCALCAPTKTVSQTVTRNVELPAVASFDDVPSSHVFHDAILWCAGEGIVGGYNDGTFRPSNTVSRSNFTVMLSRAFYADDVTKYSTPNYLANGMFYPNYVAMMMAGALRNTTFETALQNSTEMNKGITRYDMAQLMTNIMRNKGFTASDSEKNTAIAKITDYSSIPSQYRDAVANVYALGVIGGYADGSFNGSGTMNRGQAAVVIYRMMKYFGGGSEITPPDPETPVVPGTGDVYCNCVTVTGKLCEICHVTDPGTVKPVDPTPVEPEKPVDPAPVDPTPSEPTTGKTLANGKAITVENVSEILDQLKSSYPNKTSFVNGYAGLNSGRNPGLNCISQVTKKYTANNGAQIGPVSTTIGCGAWAAFVADEIFGQTNITWKKTTLTNIRPGDLVIYLDTAGYCTHVSICTGKATGFEPTTKIQSTDANNSSTGYRIGWSNANMLNQTVDVYTAYPD